MSIQTFLAFLGEVGTDVGKYATAEHFASWLGLCPDNRITGGRTLATALRMAAQSFHRSKSSLGDWFRRIRAKLGTKAAVTAATHPLRRLPGHPFQRSSRAVVRPRGTRA